MPKRPPARTAAILLAALIFAPPSLFAQEAPLPTIEDIQQRVAAKDYRTALRDLTRVLTLKGPAAESYDRYQILMLRGECQLQLKNSAEAVRSWTQARDAALADQKFDLTFKPLAYATLLQHSTGVQYTAKTPGAKPIQLLPEDTRKTACKALFDDLLPVFQKKVAQSEKWTTVNVILDAAREGAVLYALEKVSSDTESRTQDLIDKISVRYADLVTRPLTDMNPKVAQVRTTANVVETRPVPVYDQDVKQVIIRQVTMRHGLSRGEEAELTGLSDTCAKISKSANDLTRTTGIVNDSVKTAAANADALRLQIESLLNDDYSKIPVVTPPVATPSTSPSP